MKAVAAVEVDVFSGRPNPTFELHGAKAKRLQDLLARLKTRSDRKFNEPALGFRGFLIRFNLPQAPTYHVLGTNVVRGSETFDDPDSTIHRYIISVLPAATRKLVAPFLGPN